MNSNSATSLIKILDRLSSSLKQHYMPPPPTARCISLKLPLPLFIPSLAIHVCFLPPPPPPGRVGGRGGPRARGNAERGGGGG